MVGTLVRLQLKLFRRSLQGQTGKVVALVLLGLYALGIMVALIGGLVALRGAPVAARGMATTAGFSFLTLGWPLVTLLVSGSDQTLDAGRFALFPVRARQLMPGLLLVGLLGIGGVFTVGIALAQVVTWSDSAGAAAAAVLAAVLGCATCVLLARTVAAWFSTALSSRRYRDGAALALGFLAIGSGLGMQLLASWVSQLDHVLQRAEQVGRIAAWTPFGWAWAMPWDVASGRWMSLVAHLLLSLALAAALWKAWERALDRALVSPLESGGAGGKVKDHSVIDRLLPDGPIGAVAGRSLRYWRRDPRHMVQAVAVLVMPLLIVAPTMTSGFDGFEWGRGILFPAVFGMLLMAGICVAQEISFDGSALWMHVSSGLTGRQDRLGRLLAAAWLFVPALALIDVALLTVSGSWEVAHELVGISLASLLVGMAVGSVTGAWWQIPQPPPGQNAFARGSGGGVAAMLLTFVSMLASMVLALPFLLPLLALEVGGWGSWGLSLAAPLYGLALLAGGVTWGGRVLDRTWPELLDRVTLEGN